ncbi:MAG: DUF1993 domain-containing protein [Bacteriovoracaceae bacterium]|nr:DUF1993 domain-containing protein [Bacteriovoracaceae bacterium]
MNRVVFEMGATQIIKNLHALKICMNKAKAHAEHNKFDVNKFLDMKLAPDMLNFTYQIQILSDNAKGIAARLSGTPIPVFEDKEKTWEELVTRIDNTINFIAKFKADDFAGFENAKATFPWNKEMHLKGMDYLTSFAIPNFYFHLTTAYAILRTNGVPVGKMDFLGEVNWNKN